MIDLKSRLVRDEKQFKKLLTIKCERGTIEKLLERATLCLIFEN